MKALILTLLITSSSFASETPQDALKSILDLGTYYGDGCSITLTQTIDGIVARGQNSQRTVEYLIPKTGAYRLHEGQRYFVSSKNQDDLQLSFMTRATDHDGQYFAVEQITFVGREIFKSLVECETR